MTRPGDENFKKEATCLLLILSHSMNKHSAYHPAREGADLGQGLVRRKAGQNLGVQASGILSPTLSLATV